MPAFSPAWFADQSLTPRFTPPNDVSVTGVTVTDVLRRDLYQGSDVVPGVRAPTLLMHGVVIHGVGDLLYPSVAHATAAQFPSALLTLIPGAGHMPFWDDPATFFAAVEFFLQQPTLPTTDG